MKQSFLFGSNVFLHGQEQLVSTDFIRKTEKMELHYHYRHNMVPVETMKQFLTITDGCTHGPGCRKYSNCYSCPPYTPKFEKYSEGFSHCFLYCFSLDWDSEAMTGKYFIMVVIKSLLTNIIEKYRKAVSKMMNGKTLTQGFCTICEKCNYPNGCLHPTEVSPSLEAFGLDVISLSRTFLNYEIEWLTKDHIPKYITLVNGFLTNDEEPKEMFKGVDI